MSDWKHDDLAADLARHLAGYKPSAVTWLDMQLGPSGSSRPDVYSIEHTYTALRATAYEVKISRADYLRDATAGKALGYRRFAGAVVFAAPAGLLTKAEIPDGCGLIQRHAYGWRFARKPVRSIVENLPWQVWLKLVTDGCGRELNSLGSIEIRKRAVSSYLTDELARRVLGEEIGKLYADRENARMLLAYDISQLARERKRVAAERLADRQRREVADEASASLVLAPVREAREALGLPPETPVREVVAALRSSWPETAKQQVATASKSLLSAARNLQWVMDILKSDAEKLNQEPEVEA